ncbi:hypothetical protein OIU85_024899 [Salix viminalis]|uniref:Uncharacterized protein n=1 Tax=Salix viminalis TaxID=40686 RepID=A0A9Q0Z5H1_SALVM|nr:hypothetical protein OIU85_024899 [Salix viminalis]
MGVSGLEPEPELIPSWHSSANNMVLRRSESNFEVEKLGATKRKLESNLMAREKSLAKVEEKRDGLKTQSLQQLKGLQDLQEQFTFLTIVKKKGKNCKDGENSGRSVYCSREDNRAREDKLSTP